MTREPNKNKIDIQLDNETIDGVYSNLVVINHSASEFVLDFAIITPGAPKAKVKSRVILTPEHAKRFNEAVEREEADPEPDRIAVNDAGLAHRDHRVELVVHQEEAKVLDGHHCTLRPGKSAHDAHTHTWPKHGQKEKIWWSSM